MKLQEILKQKGKEFFAEILGCNNEMKKYTEGYIAEV